MAGGVRVVFFVQAEDGIRDLTVTGVQTCALPISQGRASVRRPRGARESRVPRAHGVGRGGSGHSAARVGAGRARAAAVRVPHAPRLRPLAHARAARCVHRPPARIPAAGRAPRAVGGGMTRSALALTLKAPGDAVLVVGGFLAALPPAPASPHRPTRRALPAAPAVVGGVLLPLAGALSYTSFWLFIARGRGTAFPTDPPRALVVLGAYRYVRNPMYLGNLGIALAEGLLLRSPGALVYAVLLSAATHLYVTRVEEPALEARYGEA